MLTSERLGVGIATFWRYLVRAVVVARLDKLNAVLRTEDQQVERTEALAHETSFRSKAGGAKWATPPPSLATVNRPMGRRKTCGGVKKGAMGLGEREKELIRMKIERLDAAKVIVEREHALHGGGSAGGGAGGGGGR